MNPHPSSARQALSIACWNSWLRCLCLLAALTVFGATRTANAQLGVGTLTGKVSDASSKKALADVVVTASSTALQGEQIAVTDKSGLSGISQWINIHFRLTGDDRITKDHPGVMAIKDRLDAEYEAL